MSYWPPLVAMSATLAHEIRNPLMGLSAQAELLADSLPEDDARRDRIEVGRARVLVARAAQAVVSLLIGDYEDDVGLSCRRHRAPSSFVLPRGQCRGGAIACLLHRWPPVAAVSGSSRVVESASPAS